MKVLLITLIIVFIVKSCSSFSPEKKQISLINGQQENATQLENDSTHIIEKRYVRCVFKICSRPLKKTKKILKKKGNLRNEQKRHEMSRLLQYIISFNHMG